MAVREQQTLMHMNHVGENGRECTVAKKKNTKRGKGNVGKRLLKRRPSSEVNRGGDRKKTQAKLQPSEGHKSSAEFIPTFLFFFLLMVAVEVNFVLNVFFFGGLL